MNSNYPLAGRDSHPADTIINISGATFGDGSLQLIAGPCAIESRDQLLTIAEAVASSGATMLRGGAFKPRTSPYAFQGLGVEAFEYLREAKALTGLPVVTEIMEISQLPLFEDIDVIQVGAKNMQNYSLLRALGKSSKPVLLKHGWSNTIEELLLSAEYILAEGNPNVILCERGIRTFEPMTRNTFDVSAIPLLKELTHLPVIADPSHGTGRSDLVAPVSMAAVAAGADGLMLEIHDNPTCALCDGKQAISTKEFHKLTSAVKAIAPYAFKG
ncbi:MAG TPA: 3-deoxy-7-phosphoheptulonate synthase [Anaerovoracaceae bacterium]|nr:3-deoxy-7-phosphoheptulonate synthase [Anaerovoracaceae bacterium]